MKHDTKTCQCPSCIIQRSVESENARKAAAKLGCVDCGWTGTKLDAKYYAQQRAYECPSCGSDAIDYAEYLTEKGEDR
jgi:predicted RNA-binding Zn-ribbon protein involved in translation (DUF1610 family)